MQRSSVVLPQPLGPSRVVTVPSGTWRSMPSRAATALPAPWTVLRTFSTRISIDRSPAAVPARPPRPAARGGHCGWSPPRAAGLREASAPLGDLFGGRRAQRQGLGVGGAVDGRVRPGRQHVLADLLGEDRAGLGAEPVVDE